MRPSLPQTSERIHPEYVFRSQEAYLEYLRHIFAYDWVKGHLTLENTVLEIGSGDGYGAALLVPTVQRMAAVDIDRQTLLAAAQKYAEINSIFAVYDGMRLPYGAQVFDAIIIFQVIEHVPQTTAWLHDIRRVLKPGGTAFFTTPNACNRLSPGQKPWNLHHVREYTPQELLFLLKPFFTDVEVRGIRGTGDIQAIERARVQRVRRLSRLDPFRMRRFIPAPTLSWGLAFLRKIMGRDRGASPGVEAMKNYCLSDYRVVEDDVNTCLDLLAVCHCC